MQDLKVAIVQANQFWENKPANFENYERLLADVSEADLILLPEMFQTGFSMNVEKLGENWENAESIAWLKELANEKQAAVYTSLIIEDQNCFYNRGVFVEPNGELHFYDKRKSFGLAGEDQFFTAGNRETIVRYKNWNFQLQICYDLRFPEIVRNGILESETPNYDAILYVANWPEKRAEHWKSLLQARAIENQCYVLGVNRIGEDHSNFKYSGDSACIDPLGTIDACTPHREEVKVSTLSAIKLAEIRKSLPFLKDIKR
jgi:omega-amidase